jgi:hypothetical protein
MLSTQFAELLKLEVGGNSRILDARQRDGNGREIQGINLVSVIIIGAAAPDKQAVGGGIGDSPAPGADNVSARLRE